MSSVRNIDLKSDSSIKQGSRIIHPVYAKYVIKDEKVSRENLSKSVGEPHRNNTTINLPVNTRLSNRLRSLDQKSLVPTIEDKCGYYRQKLSTEILDSLPESKVDTINIRKDATEVKESVSSSSAAAEQTSQAIVKDNLTEKNKKSSVEQKRFYQRKLTGFSPIKLLPVGRFFKFLRPPLQRRNSCPILSISESKQQGKVTQTPILKTDSEIRNSKNGKDGNEQNRSCRLTKWTSHLELTRSKEANRGNSSQNVSESQGNETNTSTKNSEREASQKTYRGESQRDCDNVSVESNVAINHKSNKLHALPENKKSSRELLESSVVEKTVIIVSENSSLISGETAKIYNKTNCKALEDAKLSEIKTSEVKVVANEHKTCEKIKVSDEVTVSMNSTCSNFDTTKERNELNNYSENNKPVEVYNGDIIQIQQLQSSESRSTTTALETKSHFDTPSPKSQHLENRIKTIHNSEKSLSERETDLNYLHNAQRNIYNDKKSKLLLKLPVDDQKPEYIFTISSNQILDGNISDENNTCCVVVKDTKNHISPYKENAVKLNNTPCDIYSTINNEIKLNTTVSIQRDEISVTNSHSLNNSDAVSGNRNITSVTQSGSQVLTVSNNNYKDFQISDLHNVSNETLATNSIGSAQNVDSHLVFQGSYVEKTDTGSQDSTKKSELTKTLSSESVNISQKKVESDICQPHLISITCNQIATKSIDNPSGNEYSGIKVSVVNSANFQNDILDFGETVSQASTPEMQQEDINECYNVKLDAPEEVIVAGFHDFCHTMLSLEENGDSQDTGTVKRKVVNKKQKSKNEETMKQNCEDSKERSGKVSNDKLDSKPSPSRQFSEYENYNNKFDKSYNNGDEINKNTSDKLLEEIQNSKLLEKISIKDPDVIDAITTLDKSLMEASEQQIVSLKCSPDVNSSDTKRKHKGNDNSGVKNPIKVLKEDKIQCDNLIEELMLEDISKKVPNALKMDAASSGRGECIAVTISNMNASSPCNSQTVQTSTQKCSPTITESQTQNNTKMQLDENFNSKTENSSVKISAKTSGAQMRNIHETLNDTYADYCLPDEALKSVNVTLDNKDDSSSLPTSVTSEDTNTGMPLQLSVDNNSNNGLHDVVACNRTSPCSVDSGTSSHNQAYFVVVAIDFGTTYSGYAFSFTRDPENIHMMKKWDGGDPGVFNQKTPTTLLLSPEGSFYSFGYSARDYYHDLDADEAKRWLYFEKFKMTLHHNEHLSLGTEIAAANGKRMPAVTIFAHALRYFKDQALQELSDQSATRILNEDVRWVVTVPAIWKQPAKQFMRAAAYKAGIASPEFPDQLLIALEPEAASIYCRRMRLHQLVPEETQFQRSSFHWQKDNESEAGSIISEKDTSFSTIAWQMSDSSFTVGTRYMVVDCGGGTVDITVHELLDKQGTLKELQKASGGPYGSIGVDMEFETLLNDIFGEDFMQQFKSKRPTGFVDLMIAFEARKRNANPYKSNPLNISLPFSFIDYYKKYRGSSVETAIKKSSHKNVKWSSQGMLRLEQCVMESLFQKTVQEIRKHIENIINQEDMFIDHIFLVGGFAESLFLQKEIKDAFSSRIKVIIPQGVSLAILKGAVLFGLDPTTVNNRRLRMTYGVGVLTRFIHGVHPREKLVIKDGIQWCADVFDTFVVNEQSVGVGDVVVRRYTPTKDGQSCSVIHIYCTEKDNVYFITDPGVKRCATLILDLSDSRYIQSREIQIGMMFGDTEIKVSALDVTTGKCVKAEIDFLNH